jgi:hypothetical protein
MDFRTGLGDRFHDGSVACNISRNIGNDCEGCDSLELFLCRGGRNGQYCRQRRSRHSGQDQSSQLVEHLFLTLAIRSYLQLKYSIPARKQDHLHTGKNPLGSHILQLQMNCNKELLKRGIFARNAGAVFNKP